MVELGEFALTIILDLIKSVIQDGIKYAGLSYFERRKIERQIEDATAQVVEPLLPFLTHEGFSTEQQRLILQTCVEELHPLTQEPERLFEGSLNGQKIFEDCYKDRALPQVISENNLKEIYALLFPRIATLLCKIPQAVKGWEAEAWSENYRRLDEISLQMNTVFTSVDALANQPIRIADETLALVRRAMAQKIRLDMDLTGLRADQPVTGNLDDFFVHPEIVEVLEDKERQPKHLQTTKESFLQFIQPFCYSVLIGAPGAGKSTWSKWLQRETLSVRWQGIGVRIELRRISGQALPNLYELIREQVSTVLQEDLTTEILRDWMEARVITFILDGFDEIQPGNRDQVLEWMNDLRAASRGCPFILTSRPLTTDHLEQLQVKWQTWTVKGFDQDCIVTYIQKWYAHTPLLAENRRSIDAENLARSWLEDPTIGPLTSNPLLLSTLLMVHHLDGQLPNGRSQLYRRYVDGMLGIWDDRRKVLASRIQISLEQKRQIIRSFALFLFLTSQDQLDEPETLQWLELYLKKELNLQLPVEEVLYSIMERSGLIVGPGAFSFVHKTVGEYLVAESILQGDQHDTSGTRLDRWYLFDQRDDDRWNTIIFLWAGLAPIADVEAFIDRSIKVENWQLAFGLLDDQTPRLSLEIRRSLLLECFVANRNFKTSLRKSSIKLLISLPYFLSVELEIQSFPVRTISGFYFTYVHDVLRRAYRDGVFTWKDYKLFRGSMRDVFWFCMIGMKSDITGLRFALSCPTPKTADRFTWLFWVADSIVYRQFIQDEPQTSSEALLAFQEICPDASGLLPLAFMVVPLEYEVMENEPILDFQKILYTALKALQASVSQQVIPLWLEGTAAWEIFYQGSVDLFATFEQRVEEQVRVNAIPQDEVYKAAMGYLTELKAQREELLDKSNYNPANR